MPAPALADIERAFREEYGRAAAVLTRVFGDVDTAEDAVQDAFAEAVRWWPEAGLPAVADRRRRYGRSGLPMAQ